MNKNFASVLGFFRKHLVLVLTMWILGLVAIRPAQAADQIGGQVQYTPVTQIVSGNMPFTSSYVLAVKSPTNFPLGQTATIGFTVSPIIVPAGMTLPTAASFVTITPVAGGTFTAGDQTLTFNVTTNFPLVAPPAGSSSVSYTYQVYTTNWPASIAGQFSDFGASIGATASVASSGGQPPTVTITTPQDMDTFTYPADTVFPVQLPLAFQATGIAGFPIASVDANLGGLPLVVTPSALMQVVVNATASMTIPGPGIYTVQARGTSSAGTSSAAVTFTVKVAKPPPTVVINTPSDGATFSLNPGSTLSIPFTFTGTSQSLGITALTATLDGNAVSFTASGLNTLIATGTTNLAVATAGTHVLVVTAKDDIATVSATSRFVALPTSPMPAIVITQPLNGTSLTHTVGTPALNVPFAFTTTSPGFTVTAVSAKLDNNPVAITSTTGLGTDTATSTGTLLGVAAGTHTLAAFGVSGGVTVNTSVTFTITETGTLPPTVVINTPVAGSTYTYLAGSPPLSIPLTFTGTSRANGITALSATLDGVALTVATNNLGQLVATGSSTMSVATGGTHTIVVKATDSQGTATASRTFTVCVVKPVLCLDITKPDDCATYTRVAGSAATQVPLAFTARETNGTVTGFSAKLNNVAITLATTTGLNTGTATGTATLSVTTAGTYTVVVTATGTGGLTATDTAKFTVKETQPAPQPCATKVLWLGACAQGKVLSGGCAVDVWFQIQQSVTGAGSTCGDDDDDHHSYWGGGYGYTYSYGSWCDDDDDDGHNSDDDNSGQWGSGGSSCVLLADKTVILSVSEVYANGSTSAAKNYTYSSTRADSSHYVIDSSKRYKTSFKPGSGTHRYRFEVYYFAPGSTKPKVIGTSEITTK